MIAEFIGKSHSIRIFRGALYLMGLKWLLGGVSVKPTGSIVWIDCNCLVAFFALDERRLSLDRWIPMPLRAQVHHQVRAGLPRCRRHCLGIDQIPRNRE